MYKRQEKILIEIMRINAGHEDAGTLLALCKRKSDKDLFVIFKALAVVSLFVAISITKMCIRDRVCTL